MRPGMKLAWISLIPLTACPVATAVEVIQPLVPFELVPASGSTNRLSLTLRETVVGIFSSSDMTTITGDFTGNVRVDVVGSNVEVTGIEFTGGQFALTDMSFGITIPFTGSITASTSDLRGTIDTIPPFGDVSDGQFNTIDHEVTVNQGVINVGGDIVPPTTVDFDTEPLALTTDATGSTVLSVEGQDGNVVDYRLRITLPIDVTESIPDQPAEIEASGNIVADGFFSLDFGLTGDYNGDNAVDAADYTVWRDTLGTIGDGLAADGNNNGEIDPGDYEVWRENFGSMAAASLAGSSVPEPATIVTASLIGLLLAFRRRTG